MRQIILSIILISNAVAFLPSRPNLISYGNVKSTVSPSSPLYASNDDDRLSERVGEYTLKQRLREEVDSPFRKVRLVFFGSSAASALTALYFSATNSLKAYLGTYANAPPLEESLTSCAINLGGFVICGALAFREYSKGQENLQRIAKGGMLARLDVSTANDERSSIPLSNYRRESRVMICAGSKEYISKLCKSMNADERSDENTIGKMLQSVDVLVVPVLLKDLGGDSFSVTDSRPYWYNEGTSEDDKTFDPKRSDEVVAFPRGNLWTEYLKSDIETANKQGFNVLEKGFTIVVKKNGKILRRISGLPNWGDFIGSMEVLDGSKFGMPGDSEKYGGP